MSNKTVSGYASAGARIIFCDVLRGLAAIVVVVAHFVFGFGSLLGWLYNPDNLDNLYPVWVSNFSFVDGAFGVALFF